MRSHKKRPNPWGWILTILVAVLSVVLLVNPVKSLFYGSGLQTDDQPGATVQAAVLERYNMYINNRIASALDGVLSVRKVFWLSDHDQVAPEPNPDNYGTADSAAKMDKFLEDAQVVLGGQNTIFNRDIELMPGTKITYYLDETIMVITWKQVIHNAAYTFSEVRICHPSQFRRFLAGGTYGSGIQLETTDMAASVNAVVASSGDFYAFRPIGIKVYEGLVRNANGKTVDSCFIDEKGDMNFVRAGVMTKTDQVQDYVDEKNIRFSLSFGPVMIENGIKQPLNPDYPVGEIGSRYSRAALCQVDELHYLLVTANMENGYESVPNMTMLQQTLLDLGVKHAYALDGGQTAALVMNDTLINRVDWGVQRKISDIIYFATAIPG